MKRLVIILAATMMGAGAFASSPTSPTVLAQESTSLSNVILKNANEINSKLAAAGLSNATIYGGTVAAEGPPNPTTEYVLNLELCPASGVPVPCKRNAGSIKIDLSLDLATSVYSTYIVVIPN